MSWMFIKRAHFASPPFKSRGLSRKRFLCHVLVLLHKIQDFLPFPLNLYVVNEKIDIAAERRVDR